MYDNVSEFLHFMPESTGIFQSTGDLFIFVGILVIIGTYGVYAIYKIWKDFFNV